MTTKVIRTLWTAIVVLLVATAYCGWMLLRQSSSTRQMVSVGTLDYYPMFNSQYIDSRDVAVWLPDGYQIGDPCDVLYMHDGQMLFDASTTWNHQEWHVDEIVDSLINKGAIRPCIVVAINNTDNRLEEYFPNKVWQYLPENERDEKDLEKMDGDDYLRFLVQELKPFIDKHYRPLTSREHTFVMGSSMGGLISLYALCEYPKVFGGAACLSTHSSMQYLPVVDSDHEPWAAALRSYLETHLPQPGTSKLYMDHGTHGYDGDYTMYQDRIDEILLKKKWGENDYKSLTFNGHDHSESSWALRLYEPLQFLISNQT